MENKDTKKKSYKTSAIMLLVLVLILIYACNVMGDTIEKTVLQTALGVFGVVGFFILVTKE